MAEGGARGPNSKSDAVAPTDTTSPAPPDPLLADPILADPILADTVLGFAHHWPINTDEGIDVLIDETGVAAQVGGRVVVRLSIDALRAIVEGRRGGLLITAGPFIERETPGT